VEVAAVESALAKTERVMPENLLQQARALQETITFHIDLPPIRIQNELVTLLSSAVQQHRQVHLRYRSWEGEETERGFEPYGIVFNEGYWYTAGYCRLRQDLRTFRLDRISALELREQIFEPLNDFDVLEHVLSSLFSRPGIDQVEVVMSTTMERARQVTSPDMGTLEETEQGIIFRRAADHLEWVAFFLMCLDFPVMVIQPAALRDLLQQMAAKALEMAREQA
jgi:predicted DNA-binding transcriptional regulator YafY